jgi:maltose alpha-D-glucosyltransferase/alpha-amylase
VQDDAYIIDFEGEPARSVAERRLKSSPLRDVAGLLRSLDYAAAVAARGEDGAAPVVDERLETYLAAFRDRASENFLAAYRAELAEAPYPWIDEQAIEPLLDLFLIEKAAYEVAYEAANRPHWLAVPLTGLHSIVERLEAADLTRELDA